MFRSKSFNINRPSISGHLIRSKSFSEIFPISFNIRHSIVIKEANPSEVCSNMKEIIRNTMNNDWIDFNSAPCLNDEQRRWKARYDDALEIFNEVCSNSEIHILLSRPDKKTFFYIAYYMGHPIGVLQLSMYYKLPKVAFLATHCGIQGCGKLLIEYAVNKSQQLGHNGKLYLKSLDNAQHVYKSMGFINAGEYLELNPAERTDKWIWNSVKNCYKFKFF